MTSLVRIGLKTHSKSELGYPNQACFCICLAKTIERLVLIRSQRKTYKHDQTPKSNRKKIMKGGSGREKGGKQREGDGGGEERERGKEGDMTPNNGN